VNANQLITVGWSNSDSETLYLAQWPHEPICREQYLMGRQCGGCSYFASLNADWGLCCRGSSRHYLETVFEHFTCPSYVHEGWGPHSFTENEEFHCRCGGAE
jgi:hypothetical protein